MVVNCSAQVRVDPGCQLCGEVCFAYLSQWYHQMHLKAFYEVS